MELTDVIQIISISGVFFFVLGWTSKSRVRKGLRALQSFFLKPRYLKTAGFLSNTNHSAQTKKK
ncbi:cellulose biosynthesis protein BcsF [Legionella fallonii]|uniref:cellulose biosynthesis protein BcsF n=1 Tax=Legionella fallonii TaxID=96230 RepID=UPI0005D36F76|nr:cellulose biosynthesis protein BcsF [Legionella fallonii]